ncbi:MAG: response regulator [Candidatus Sungbacteria bacterium]|uniref:Response regulator n=1 Tax=Candidatus Sungiibacteriota bacterium TaxID=2750080 RepID=A0A932QYS2_9BACT|nr:response regulator [Candidatus Sungbacteria bacterium]
MADGEKKQRVLLIEDDVFMGDLLAQAVAHAGFDIMNAKTSDEGVKVFQEWHPDLILLDLILPDQNGFEALRQIRRMPGGLDTKVIIVSNLSRETQWDEAKRLGVLDYLIKSNFSLDEIIQKVKEVLNTP